MLVMAANLRKPTNGAGHIIVHKCVRCAQTICRRERDLAQDQRVNVLSEAWGVTPPTSKLRGAIEKLKRKYL